MRHFLKKILTISVKLIETLIQFAMILLYAKIKYIRNLKPNANRGNLIVLGNGPSFEKEFITISKFEKSYAFDFICVNNFANYEYFETIKPKNYVLIDPYYFKETTDQHLSNIKKKLYENIELKTKWPLNLYIPRFYKNSGLIKGLLNNPNIKLIPINNVPLAGGFEVIKQFLFSKRLGNPIFQNVLIASSFIGIQKCYNSILVFGADHSWLINIKVLNNNQITLNDQHIDIKNKDQIILVEENGKPKKLHTFIRQLSVMFMEYHTLNNYAKTKNIEIKNMTKSSFIDAFERE